jgi:proteasome activator subunit 4
MSKLSRGATSVSSSDNVIDHRVAGRALYIDKQPSGFLTWAPETKAYTPVPAGDPPITWEPASKMALEAIGGVIAQAEYFDKLMVLWGQESSRNVTSPELRTDNVAFIKTIGNNPAFQNTSVCSRCGTAKISQGVGFENILNSVEELLWDADRYKQRAAAEVLAGITRGMPACALNNMEYG